MYLRLIWFSFLTHFFNRSLPPTLSPSEVRLSSCTLCLLFSRSALTELLLSQSSDTPQINPDVDATNEDTPKFINVLANDQVAQGGGELVVTEGSDSIQGGNCTLFGGLFIRYMPPEGFVGTDECFYRACDDLDQCGNALITITVNELTVEPTLEPSKQPTAAPEIKDDEFTVLVDVLTSLPVLQNDVAGIPPDGNSLRVVSGSNSDQGGTCVPRNNQQVIRYAPPAGFSGVDRCTYRACDDVEQCGTAAITISVQATGSVSLDARSSHFVTISSLNCASLYSLKALVLPNRSTVRFPNL